MSLFVRSPSGLLHLVSELLGAHPSRPLSEAGRYRTACGRLVERGWSQRPRRLRDLGDPHVCGVCRRLLPIPVVGTRAAVDARIAINERVERRLEEKLA